MAVLISEDKIAQERASANLIRKAISKNRKANIIVATGASQFDMLDVLVREDIDEVPTSAISTSVERIMQSNHVICSLTDKRKAQVVKKVDEVPLSQEVPASILQEHKSSYLFLDKDSSDLINNKS